MRSLEARFHFTVGDSDRYVVVGQVVWDGGRDEAHPRVEPSPSLRQVSAPVTLLMTLRHLLVTAGPGAFDRLRDLKNTSWSFVEVGSGSEGPNTSI
jgi:hypothetical protein